jgi:hypothetical protein
VSKDRRHERAGTLPDRCTVPDGTRSYRPVSPGLCQATRRSGLCNVRPWSLSLRRDRKVFCFVGRYTSVPDLGGDAPPATSCPCSYHSRNRDTPCSAMC